MRAPLRGGRAALPARARGRGRRRRLAPRPGPARALHPEEARPPRCRDRPGRSRDAALAGLARLLLHPRRPAARLRREHAGARRRAAADDRVELAARARDRRAARSCRTRCAAAAASSPPTTWRCCTAASATTPRHGAGASARRRCAATRADASRARPPTAPPTELAGPSRPISALRRPAAAYPRRHRFFAGAACARRPLLDMALALPDPAAPGSSPAHARAHRRWQAGQAHAQREQWPLAAQRVRAGGRLHGDPAYALARGACPDQGRPRRRCGTTRAAACAPPTRARRSPTRSNRTPCSASAAPRRRSSACGRCRPTSPRDHDHHVSLAVALQRCRRHEEAIRSFFDALALKMDDALSHFRLGMSFKDLGMKAEAAECVRTAVVLGLGSSELAARGQLVFLEREACRWAERRRGHGRPARAPCARCPTTRRSRPAPSRTPCSSTIRSSSSRSRATTRCTSPRCTGRCRAASRAPARRAPAHRLPLGRLPPARDQPADGADARVPRPQRASR